MRKQANFSKNFDIAWSLRSLHHIATGLQQLHNNGIAHQDLKPSNVLVFNNNTSKITDFGRSAFKGHEPPHEDLIVPGDLGYAPPELLYGHSNPDWIQRRFGCDAFLMGSMVVYFFLGVGITQLLLYELPQNLRWDKWRGNYYEVLPYLRNAFQKILIRLKNEIPIEIQNSLIEVVAQLCEPDPQLRGDPKKRNGPDQYSMERYISRFNILARHAELGLIDLFKQ